MFDISCFNGNFIEYQDLNIHVSDLGLQRGYGIFDFFAVIDGKINSKDDYFDRFFSSLKLARLPISYSPDDVESLIYQLIVKNNSPDSYIKLIATGGYSIDGYSFSGNTNFIILNMPKKEKKNIDYENGQNLISQEYLRPNPKIKSLNYFNSALLQSKMREYEAIDVLYHMNGNISETSRSNVFMINKNGTVSTTGENILEGITRKNVLKALNSSVHKVEIRNISLEELLTAEEVFITSTTKEVMPIVRIDHHIIANGNPGPITRDIMSIFNV